jgi:peptidoglycan/LPS O-acetylase OafA/YrhL
MTSGDFGDSRAARKFLLRRAIRVIPPYWFFTLVAAAVVIGFGGRLRNTTATPVTLLTSLGFIPWPRVDGQIYPIIAQGWTLNYEAFFYLAFGACMTMRRGLATVVAFMVVVAAAHALVPSRYFIAWFFTDPVILEFVAGILLARLYVAGIRLNGIIAAGAVIAAPFVYALMPSPGYGLDRILGLGIPAFLVVGALVLGPEPKRVGPILGGLKRGGDASYTLYLSHTLVVGTVLLACRSAGLHNAAVAIVLAMATAIAFAMLFYTLVEAPVVAAIGRRLGARVSQGGPTVAP